MIYSLYELIVLTCPNFVQELFLDFPVYTLHAQSTLTITDHLVEYAVTDVCAWFY